MKAWPSTPEGEERQAREVLQHYKTLFAHPLVTGITWWDFSDGQWLNAPSGLIRKDATSKPAYDELLKLIKDEWWMPSTRFATDQEGRIHFRGFFGEYELTCAGRKVSFLLTEEAATTIEIHL